MTEVEGNLWNELGRADLILVTTNSYVNKGGRLVMGRGAAQEAAGRWPELPKMLGRWVLDGCGHLGIYGAVFVSQHLLKTFSDIGAFQVKRDFKDPAEPSLIAWSVQRLTDLLAESPGRYGRVAMNYPGIGNGQLDVVQVEPVIRSLPDNVFVYRRPEERWRTRKTTA